MAPLDREQERERELELEREREMERERELEREREQELERELEQEHMTFLIDMPLYLARAELRSARLEYIETVRGTLEHAMATLRYGKAIRDVRKHLPIRLPMLLRRQAE